nr:partner and localizer of BRCA2 isoform X1 [Pogona vitticeps]
MEPARDRALTPQEKAQLKEKLALLKREYTRTFHRLKRAERAEKVKRYVKKTVAEQNLLLLQGKAEKDDTEPLGRSAHEGASGKVQVGPCSSASPPKPTYVSFKPEAEVFGPEDDLPQSSGSEHASKGCGRPCLSLERPVAGKRQSQLSRRKTRASWGAAFALEKREASSGSETLQREPASVGRSQSPVFKRRRSSQEALETGKMCLSATTEGGSSGITPVVPEPERSQETILPSLSHSLACRSSQAGRGASPDHPREAGILAFAEGAVAQADFQNARKEPALVEKEQVQGQAVEENPGGWAGSAVSGGPAPHVWLGEERTCREAENSGSYNGDSSISRPNAEGLGDRLEAGSPFLEGDSSAASPKNVLSSCTVVEGLLFPVEYYVRTTRRMSSCQREVNLEAVIQSQLGKSRRGKRLPHKETLAERGEGLPALGAHGATASPLPPASPSRVSGAVSRRSSCLAESEEILPPRGRGRLGRGASSCTSQDLLEVTRPEAASGLPPRGKEGSSGEGRAAAFQLNVELKRRARRGPAALRCRARRGLEAASEAALSSPVPEVASGLPASNGNSTLCLFESQLPEQDGNLGWPGPELGEAASPPDESPEASLDGGRGRRPQRSPSLSGSDFGASASTGTRKEEEEEEEGSLFKRLPSRLNVQEFCLPEEEFGLLKLEKCKPSPATSLEAPDAAESPGAPPCDGRTGPEPGATLREDSSGGPVPAGKEPSSPRWLPPGLLGKGFPSSEWLLSPALEGGSCPRESQLLTPAFPLVGATPASQALPPSQILSQTLSVAPSQGTPNAGRETGPLGEASSPPGSGTRRPRSQSQGKPSRGPEGEALSLEERQSPAAESLHHNRDTSEQKETTAKGPVEALDDCRREGRLQMTSKLQSFSGSCLVDVSTVEWEAAELCLVTATGRTVILWKHLDPDHWEAACTWHSAKVPVLRIIPLPGACCFVCVALGCLEVEELRFLLPSSEAGCFEQSLAKAGDVKALLGLQGRRLVTSCGSLQGQEVEVTSFSKAGRSRDRWALMAPEETLKAFAEVDGMEEALVGMTAVNSVVVWNVTSGQLLRRIPVGYSYPATLCPRAYSDLGLLFVVVSHPRSKESKSCGRPAFRLVALNPKTARSLGVMALSLPPGTGGRVPKNFEFLVALLKWDDRELLEILKADLWHEASPFNAQR